MVPFQTDNNEKLEKHRLPERPNPNGNAIDNIKSSINKNRCMQKIDTRVSL